MEPAPHVPVLCEEVCDLLTVQRGDIVCDATVGSGGHLSAICERFNGDVTLLGIDADPRALDMARRSVHTAGCNASFVCGNFRHIAELVSSFGVTSVDRVIFDLGFRSDQLTDSTRGFSFRGDQTLDMRFGTNSNHPTAYDVVNTWSEGTLSTILRGYGEERYAKRIARAIVERRQENRIQSTADLVNVIYKATPRRYHTGRLHPATRTFQAIRMAVNDEISVLKEGLQDAFGILSNRGRIAVISFHSIEDRIVKQQFRAWADQREGVRITKKPIRPTYTEREGNPRSRSAKLRVIEKNV